MLMVMPRLTITSTNSQGMSAMVMLAGGEVSHLVAAIKAKALFHATNNSSAPSHSSGPEEAFLRLLPDSPDNRDLCVSIVTYKYRQDATQAWIIITI